MSNWKFLILVLAVWRVGDWCSAEETDEPESEPDAKSLPEPESKPGPEPSCNIWYRNYQWTLQDCLCRPFQNEFLMDIENDQRVEGGQKPLVPVSEDLCINFIPEKCPIGFPVVALFPVPAPCGCNSKKGSIETKRFYSLNHLLKFSAENRKPFLSYSYIWPV